MPQLIHKKEGHPPIARIIPAKTWRQRIQGLIGHPGLKEKEAFWIPKCPSIHTFFMKFPIDVIFTDKKFQIQNLFENIPSNKLIFGGLKSRNAFEMKAGQIQTHQLKKGDFLYVES